MRYSNNVLAGIAYIFFGALCLILRTDVLFLAANCLGIFLCLMGIMELISANIYGGVVSLCLGILALALGWLVLWVWLYIAAAGIIAFGIYKLNSYCKKKAVNDPFWCPESVRAILLIVCGVIMFLNLWATVSAIFVIIGILLIVTGIMAILDN